jgi:hypothetical protein
VRFVSTRYPARLFHDMWAWVRMLDRRLQRS